jgi:uncharacterized membrane protein
VLLRRSFLILSGAWAAAIPLGVFAASRDSGSSVVYGFALGVYAIGRLVCHQLPARSFHLWMTSFPVCARCTGIYAGAAATSILFALVPRASVETRQKIGTRSVLLMALVPTAGTLVFEWVTGVMPAHWIRAAAGLPLGAAVAWAIGMVN